MRKANLLLIEQAKANFDEASKKATAAANKHLATAKPVTHFPTMTLRWFPAPKGHKYGQWVLRQLFMGSDGSTRWVLVEHASAEEIKSAEGQEK